MGGVACCDGYLPRFQLTRWPSCGDFPAYISDTDDSPRSPYSWAPSVTLVGAANQPLSKYSRLPAHFYHARLRRCLKVFTIITLGLACCLFTWQPTFRARSSTSQGVLEETAISPGPTFEGELKHAGFCSLRYLLSSAMFRNPLDIFPRQRAQGRFPRSSPRKWRE